MFLTGRIAVVDDDGRAVDEALLPGTLGRAAFAALVLERQRIASDALAERLWPAGPPADWAKSLPPLISKLRRALRAVADDRDDSRPGIEARDGGYEIALPSQVWIDLEDGARRLDRAEGALRTGDVRAAWLDAAPASAIFRRSFLAGFDAPWVDTVRDRLTDRAYRSWLVLGEVWRRQEEFALARTAAVEAIGADRWREDAHRLLIRVELESGNRASARRAAQACVELLRGDLGVEPSAQTQAVIDEAGGSSG